MKKLIETAQIAAATAIALGPVAALAQGLPGGQVLPPGVSGRSVTTSGLTNLLNQASQFLVTIAVIIAIIMIVWGGIVWMTKGSEKGKTFITNGIIGVAIVLGVGVILATVARIVGTQSL